MRSIHHGLLDPKFPYQNPTKGRLRYPKGQIAHSGSKAWVLGFGAWEFGFVTPPSQCMATKQVM